MPDSGHLPVLVDAVARLLDPRPGQVCLDCTVGRGGHAAVLLPRLGPAGRYVGVDLDPANVAHCSAALGPLAETAGVDLTVVQGSFADAARILAMVNIERVDVLLADLGFSSTQMDDPARGLSFAADGPLDMRLDPDAEISAAQLVNELPQDELADLIYRYGEERKSRKIARKIVETRTQRPIQTTGELADLVRRAVTYGAVKGARSRPAGGRRQRIDPATRTFMALRIAVNGELESLDRLLTDMPRLLAPGARAGIISFHSLEDRGVKQRFRTWSDEGRCGLLTRRPDRPDESEAAANPRSRSARLRVIRWHGPADT